jgi:hypothetical protein
MVFTNSHTSLLQAEELLLELDHTSWKMMSPEVVLKFHPSDVSWVVRAPMYESHQSDVDVSRRPNAYEIISLLVH